MDPFVNGGMKGSNSETFLTRVAEPPPNEDFGLANGLNDLSGVVRITVIFVKKCLSVMPHLQLSSQY